MPTLIQSPRMDNACRVDSGRAFFPVFLLASSSILSGVLISARFGWRKGVSVVFLHLDERRQVYHCWSVSATMLQRTSWHENLPTTGANARSCGSPTIHIISVYLIVWGTLDQDARPCSRLANQRGEYHASRVTSILTLLVIASRIIAAMSFTVLKMTCISLPSLLNKQSSSLLNCVRFIIVFDIFERIEHITQLSITVFGLKNSCHDAAIRGMSVEKNAYRFKKFLHPYLQKSR